MSNCSAITLLRDADTHNFKDQDVSSLVIIFYVWTIHTMRRNQQDIGLTLDYFDIVFIFGHITFITGNTLHINILSVYCRLTLGNI